MSFHVLRNRARVRLEPRPIQASGAATQDAELLGLALLHSYATAGSALVELSLHPLPAALSPGEKPRVGTSNRLLAAAGKPVTNLRHEAIFLGEFERRLLQHLDGFHDRGELRQTMAKLVGEGVLTVQKDGQPITDAQQLAGLLDASIEQQLARFVRQSLLLDQPRLGVE